jgi:hypothetical protein
MIDDYNQGFTRIKPQSRRAHGGRADGDDYYSLNSAILINQRCKNNNQFPKCASIGVRIVDMYWLRVITKRIYVRVFLIVIQHSYGFAWLQLPRSLGYSGSKYAIFFNFKCS